VCLNWISEFWSEFTLAKLAVCSASQIHTAWKQIPATGIHRPKFKMALQITANAFPLYLSEVYPIYSSDVNSAEARNNFR